MLALDVFTRPRTETTTDVFVKCGRDDRIHLGTLIEARLCLPIRNEAMCMARAALLNGKLPYPETGTILVWRG